MPTTGSHATQLGGGRLRAAARGGGGATGVLVPPPLLLALQRLGINLRAALEGNDIPPVRCLHFPPLPDGLLLLPFLHPLLPPLTLGSRVPPLLLLLLPAWLLPLAPSGQPALQIRLLLPPPPLAAPCARCALGTAFVAVCCLAWAT